MVEQQANRQTGNRQMGLRSSAAVPMARRGADPTASAQSVELPEFFGVILCEIPH
jgi:hypothetical protein